MTAYFPAEVWDALERTMPEDEAVRAMKRRGAPDAIYLRRYKRECSDEIAMFTRSGVNPGQNCLETGQWLTAKPSTSDARRREWERYAQTHPGLHVVDEDGSERAWDWQELFR